MTGVRYDVMSKTLHVAPRFPGDFCSFLCTQNGYRPAGVKKGQHFLETAYGTIVVQRVKYSPRKARQTAGMANSGFVAIINSTTHRHSVAVGPA